MLNFIKQSGLSMQKQILMIQSYLQNLDALFSKQFFYVIASALIGSFH